jgi:Ski2 N-terminal region
VRGRSGQFPFAPGGLDALGVDTEGGRFRVTEKTVLGPLVSIPPGFTRGLRVAGDGDTVDLEGTELEEGTEGEVVVRSVHLNHVAGGRNKGVQKTGYEGIDDLLPDEVPSPSNMS